LQASTTHNTLKPALTLLHKTCLPMLTDQISFRPNREALAPRRGTWRNDDWWILWPIGR